MKNPWNKHIFITNFYWTVCVLSYCTARYDLFFNTTQIIHILNQNISLDYLDAQPGIKVKSIVINAKLRDSRNNLTRFYFGQRFVYVKGNFSPVLSGVSRISFRGGGVQNIFGKVVFAWHFAQPRVR